MCFILDYPVWPFKPFLGGMLKDTKKATNSQCKLVALNFIILRNTLFNDWCLELVEELYYRHLLNVPV